MKCISVRTPLETQDFASLHSTTFPEAGQCFVDANWKQFVAVKKKLYFRTWK